jgi:hypothetical protein
MVYIYCRKSVLLVGSLPVDPESKLLLALYANPAGKNQVSIKDQMAQDWFANFATKFICRHTIG